MVDRLEELLALLENEDDDEERADVLELVAGRLVPVAPAPKNGDGDQPEDAAEETALPPLGREERVLADVKELDWARNTQTAPAKKRDEAETDGPSGGGGDEGGSAGTIPEALWREGLAVPVPRQGGAAVLRAPGIGDVEPPGPEAAKAAERAAAEMDAALESRTAGDRGLETLYRQTVQAGRPAAQTLGAEQAGRTVRAEEPGRTAALTVDELDRAVRRDSRRYDGGMTIF